MFSCCLVASIRCGTRQKARIQLLLLGSSSLP